MLKNKKHFLLMLISLVSLHLHAFPLYYKCGAGDRLEDSFAGPEILQQVQALLEGSSNTSEFRQQANIFCRGASECIAEVERIKSLLGDTQDVMIRILNTREIYNSQINFSSEVNQAEYERIKVVVDQAFTLHACQEIKRTWDPESWVAEDQDRFAVYYPKYNNYMYATGCRGRASSATCAPNRISNYKEKIKSALLMGMDPYLAISLVWMEGGTEQGLDYLYLDPIAKFGALGCTSTNISGDEFGNMTLDSYGTYYNVDPRVVNRPSISSKLVDFQRAKGKPTTPGDSYFCRKVYDDLGIVYDEPQEDSCCLKLPFTKSSADIELIEEALIFEQARKNYQRRFGDNEDPAFRIQRFNGYTRLMGAAEGVDSFRAGVDYYENPAYGYQAMDYLVNSILPNPIIRGLVQEAEAEVEASLGRRSDWRSIMCVEHPGGGMFQVNSDHYFNLHRNAPRLEAAFSKWKNGEDVSSSEFNIIQQDINALLSRSIMTDEEITAPYKSLINNYFTNYYPLRNTVGSASAQQSSYDWENLSDRDLRNVGSRILGSD